MSDLNKDNENTVDFNQSIDLEDLMIFTNYANMIPGMQERLNNNLTELYDLMNDVIEESSFLMKEAINDGEYDVLDVYNGLIQQAVEFERILSYVVIRDYPDSLIDDSIIYESDDGVVVMTENLDGELYGPKEYNDFKSKSDTTFSAKVSDTAKELLGDHERTIVLDDDNLPYKSLDELRELAGKDTEHTVALDDIFSESDFDVDDDGAEVMSASELLAQSSQERNIK